METFFHFAEQIGLNHLLCQLHHIQERLAVRDPMADNHRLGDAQQGSAAIIFKVETIKEFTFDPVPVRDIIHDSASFRMTFPVNPSQTMTSALSCSKSRPSILPTKWICPFSFSSG